MGKRTTIVLPYELQIQAALYAKENGISFGELVRESLKEKMEKAPRKGRKKRDPFFADTAVFRGDVPPDLSERIDDYLYGEDA